MVQIWLSGLQFCRFWAKNALCTHVQYQDLRRTPRTSVSNSLSNPNVTYSSSPLAPPLVLTYACKEWPETSYHFKAHHLNRKYHNWLTTTVGYWCVLFYDRVIFWGGKSHLIKFISLSLSGYLSLIWGKSFKACLGYGVHENGMLRQM